MYTPVVRRILKQYKKDIQKLDCREALALAEKFYLSHNVDGKELLVEITLTPKGNTEESL